jgi:hypothetical protein
LDSRTHAVSLVLVTTARTPGSCMEALACLRILLACGAEQCVGSGISVNMLFAWARVTAGGGHVYGPFGPGGNVVAQAGVATSALEQSWRAETFQSNPSFLIHPVAYQVGSWGPFPPPKDVICSILNHTDSNLELRIGRSPLRGIAAWRPKPPLPDRKNPRLAEMANLRLGAHCQ